MPTGRGAKALLILGVLLALGVGGVLLSNAFDRRAELAAQAEVLKAQQEVEQTRAELVQERQRFLDAKGDAERHRVRAAEAAKRVAALEAERQSLLASVEAARAQTARAREEVARVPDSEVVSRIRALLERLRAPGARGRPPDCSIDGLAHQPGGVALAR